MAEYTKVFTANEFATGMKSLPFTIAGSEYNNTMPRNCLYCISYDSAIGKGIYSADCWNLIKSYIWSRGVLPVRAGDYIYNPGLYGLGDWNGRQILDVCTDVSNNFTHSKMQAGEYLLTQAEDHAGIYVGEFTSNWNGQLYTWNVIEATPIWSDGIQATYVDEQGRRFNHKGGEQRGAWYYHGKLPYVDYTNSEKKTDGISFFIGDEINIKWVNAKTIEIKKGAKK